MERGWYNTLAMRTTLFSASTFEDTLLAITASKTMEGRGSVLDRK
jgi:hypothetical protein